MTQLQHVKGLAELQRFLRALPARVAADIAEDALAAGAEVLAEQARQNLRTNMSVRSGDLIASIAVSKADDEEGRIAVKVSATGPKNEPIWVEYGTASHWIWVRDEAKPGRWTRRGFKKWSLRTMNRNANNGGSLKIGSAFVGESVVHPGAKAKPYMRPALDTKGQAAVEAVAKRVQLRLEGRGAKTTVAEAA